MIRFNKKVIAKAYLSRFGEHNVASVFVSSLPELLIPATPTKRIFDSEAGQLLTLIDRVDDLIVKWFAENPERVYPKIDPHQPLTLNGIYGHLYTGNIIMASNDYLDAGIVKVDCSPLTLPTDHPWVYYTPITPSDDVYYVNIILKYLEKKND